MPGQGWGRCGDGALLLVHGWSAGHVSWRLHRRAAPGTAGEGLRHGLEGLRHAAAEAAAKTKAAAEAGIGTRKIWTCEEVLSPDS